MAEQKNGLWRTIAAVSIGITLGISATAWMTQRSPLQETQANTASQHDRRLMQLEQAVTALTQTLQVSQTKDASPEPARIAAPANDDASRQALAQLIRDEVRQAVTDVSP